MKRMNDDNIDCIGEFDANDKICKQKCPVNIICIITKNRQNQLDIYDEIISVDTSFLKMQ
jgi:hypothetical protein